MLSYVVLALNLAVYAVGIGIALTVGGEASNDYFLQLAKVNEDVLNGQYWRCATLDCALRRARQHAAVTAARAHPPTSSGRVCHVHAA